MFDQVKALMLANGETVQGDDPSLIDHYAQLVNEQLSAMNNAWCDVQEAAEEGENEAERLVSFPRFFVCQRMGFMLPVFPDAAL